MVASPSSWAGPVHVVPGQSRMRASAGACGSCSWLETGMMPLLAHVSACESHKARLDSKGGEPGSFHGRSCKAHCKEHGFREN